MVDGNIFSVERYAVHDGGGIRTMVYFKGCPLSCLWCSNPEGQSARSQVFYFAERCIGCGRCAAACERGATRRAEDGRIVHAPPLCAGCGRCVEVCNADARRQLGRMMTVDEVMARVRRDRPFYRRSGGGVTLSGGEPTVQPAFAAALLAACHCEGIHTAMETCGFATWASLAAVAAHLDLVLYDLKHMDSREHRRLTGVPNEPILDNLLRLGDRGVPIVVRVPVIPGCNDDEQNIANTAAFASRVASLRRVELLPYHAYGTSKYPHAGMGYALDGLASPSAERMQSLSATFASHGLACVVHKG